MCEDKAGSISSIFSLENKQKRKAHYFQLWKYTKPVFQNGGHAGQGDG